MDESTEDGLYGGGMFPDSGSTCAMDDLYDLPADTIAMTEEDLHRAIERDRQKKNNHNMSKSI